MEQYETLQGRQMIAAISNLIKVALLLVLPNLFFVSGVSFAEKGNLRGSFFPLIPGSYWVTQDTFFTGETEQIVSEDLGFDSRETKMDSIEQLVPFKSGNIVKIYQRIGKNKKSGVRYEWFIDSVGTVFEVTDSSAMAKKSLSIWRLFPEKNDTVYEFGMAKRILVYDSICTDSSILLCPKWKSKNDQAVYKFKKGIGLIGKILPTSANRLVEYRIGNGPVIKKRWVMEAPTGK
jgi:hypothetical protein